MYWVWIFGVNISWAAFFNFLIIASSISILPVGFYLLYIYQKYRDVQHAKSSNEILNFQDEPQDTSEQSTPDPNTSDDTIKITGTGKKENYVFSSDNIVYIVAEDNYVIIHALDHQKLKKWMIRATMNEVENQVNKNFIRIHRSYIVNKKYIEQMTGNVSNTRIKLHSVDAELPVSRAKVLEVRQLEKFQIL